MLQDICNCIYICRGERAAKDYEEKLLEKCFDNAYLQPLNLGATTTQYHSYEPPFATNYIKS